MTRKEYMEQLKKYLKRLPKEDYDNAIEYFSEYFDEAGPENEQQVMEELGQPKEAARELLLNLLQESVGDSKDITEKKTAALPAAPLLRSLKVQLFTTRFVGFAAVACP